MLYEIAEAVAHPDHTVVITWSDGARGVADVPPWVIGPAGNQRLRRDVPRLVQTTDLSEGQATVVDVARVLSAP